MSFLQEAALVDIESSVILVAERFIGFASHVIEQSAVIPRRGADELFHPLIIAAGDVVLDRFDVFAPLGPEQSAQIVPGMTDAVTPLANKVPAELVAKLHKVSRHLAQRGGFIFYFTEPLCEVAIWALFRVVLFGGRYYYTCSRIQENYLTK